MLSELLAIALIAETIVIIALTVYNKRQSAQVTTLETASSFQDGVKAQLTVALADQQAKQDKEAKVDEVTAKTAGTDATAAAKLLNSLTPGSGS